jgi:hypothetical protein
MLACRLPLLAKAAKQAQYGSSASARRETFCETSSLASFLWTHKSGALVKKRIALCQGFDAGTACRAQVNRSFAEESHAIAG